MIRQAINNKHLQDNPYNLMGHIKSVPSNRACLDLEELVKVENVDADDPRVMRAKDMFLFS